MGENQTVLIATLQTHQMGITNSENNLVTSFSFGDNHQEHINSQPLQSNRWKSP